MEKGSYSCSKKGLIFYFVVIILITLSVNTPEILYADSFSDNFSSGSSNWTPVSGAWVAENGEYKHKKIGESYTTQSSPALFSDDFSVPNPTITTTATPFTDNFTEPDGPASQWSVKRGTFNIFSNVYAADSGNVTLSVPSDIEFENWTDYRITAKIKREGAADIYGYALIFFRLTMVDATNDNSYALLFRQTGTLELWKRVNGSWSSSLASFTIPKDNNWHDVIVLVTGSSLKVWFDKAENEPPDMIASIGDYSAGTIGVGTQAWASKFDDIQVESVSTSSYRWLDKRGVFGIQDGQYYAKGGGGRALSILSDSDSLNWSDYKIATKIKQLGAVDSSKYAIIYFRVTMVDATSENSYALLFRQTGTADLYKVNNGWETFKFLGNFSISKDNNWHDVIMLVSGSILKVWFDRDESELPDFEYRGLVDYTSGTIALGTDYSAQDWNAVFDDLTIDNIISVEATPSYLYANPGNTTTLSIKSSLDLDNLQINVTNPLNTLWILNNPSECASSKECYVVFPTDFADANIDTVGTYVFSATNGDDASVILLEVREEPLFSFIQITDTHISDLYEGPIDKMRNFIEDTNVSKVFPTPDFVVLTGDITQDGTLNQLMESKTELDNLSILYFPTVGNHDTNNESGNEKGHNWADTFGTDKFSYSWTNGNFLFLAMDVTSPYGGYGSALTSTEHKTWLQNILDANPNKYVFLFSHFGLKAIRDGGAGQNYFQGEPWSSEVRLILESHGKVVTQFFGHAHMNGMSKSNGIYYIGTMDFVGGNEYRYIEVYSDRIESHIIKGGGRYNFYWVNSNDSTHSVSLYSYGLPIEREFKVHYPSGTNAILDGISVAGNISWEDYNYEAEITLGYEDITDVPGENIAGLIFRYNDEDNYYSVLLDSAAETIKLQKKQNGAITDLASESTTIDLDTTYQLKITVFSDNIIVYLDDVLKIDITDSTFSSGKIGLRSYRAFTNYDNISVSDITGTLPNITVTPSSINFGSLNIGSNSDRTVTVRNDGTGDLIIGTISHPQSPFSIIIDNCSGQTLEPSNICTMTVRFEPIDAITYISNYNIPSNDPDENPVTVILNGTGLNHLPIAEPGGPYSSFEGQEIMLDGSGSSDIDGSIELYQWDIDNDGTYDYSSSSPTQSHTYAQQGTYTIKLRVTDNLNAIDEATTTANISDISPAADFTGSPTSGTAPLTVNFTNNSTGYYQPLSYEWDFDNSGSVDSTLESPSYIYTNPGTYTIKLTVTDFDGSTNELIRTDYITVCASLVRIAGVTPMYFSSLQEAYDASSDGDTIQSRAVSFTGDLNINRSISITLDGGYDCDYTANTGKTTLNGMMTISNGTLTIGNFVLE